MKPGLENGVFSKYRWLTVGFQVLFVLSVCIGCGKEKTEMVGLTFDSETTPLVHTEDVSTVVSDSGITRYRIQAKIWDMYSKAKEPYWYFPKKIYVEKFDSLFNVDSSVTADTAYFFSNRKLWKLIGNVKVLSLQGDILETSELYWDQNKEEIYTDKFVRVQQQSGDIVTGLGCRADQKLTDIYFFRSSALVNMNENEDIPSDTLLVQKPDSLISRP